MKRATLTSCYTVLADVLSVIFKADMCCWAFFVLFAIGQGKCLHFSNIKTILRMIK